MAISIVQTGTAQANSGTNIITFGSTQLNNLVVFTHCCTTVGGTVISLNDNVGNTYTKAIGTAAQAADVEQWYAIQAISGATRGTIVYAGVPLVFGQMYEITGIDTVSPLDKTSSGTSNTGTVLSVVSFTPSVGSSIVLANGNQGGIQTWTAGAGFTLSGTSTHAVNEYDIFSSGTTTTAPVSGTQLAAWAYVAANYKASTGTVSPSAFVGWKTLLGVGQI